MSWTSRLWATTVVIDVAGGGSAPGPQAVSATISDPRSTPRWRVSMSSILPRRRPTSRQRPRPRDEHYVGTKSDVGAVRLVSWAQPVSRSLCDSHEHPRTSLISWFGLEQVAGRFEVVWWLGT